MCSEGRKLFATVHSLGASPTLSNALLMIRLWEARGGAVGLSLVESSQKLGRYLGGVSFLISYSTWEEGEYSYGFSTLQAISSC